MANNSIQVNVSTNKTRNITVSAGGNNASVSASSDTGKLWAQVSKNWAISDSIVDNTDYSSKYYANKAKESANLAQTNVGACGDIYNSIQKVSQTVFTNLDTKSEEVLTNIDNAKTEAVDSINSTKSTVISDIEFVADGEKQEIEDLADLIKENAEDIVNRTSFAMFDTILKDHVLTYEESKGLALQGTWVYKEAVAGSRYGYSDFYNKCLEEYENAQESEWIQPKINSDGIMGGDTFAVEASSFETNVGRQPYKSFDGNSSTKWGVNNTRSGWLTFYNPIPLKVSSIVYTPSTDFPAEDGGDLEILGSNDNSDWTSLWTGNYTGSSVCTFNVNSQNYYKYYKISITNAIHNYAGLGELTINATWKAICKNANGHVFYDISIKDQIDEIFNSTGMAWMYGIDTENERIFLPRDRQLPQEKLLYICVGNTTNYEGLTDVVNQGMEILEQVNQGIESRANIDITNLSADGKSLIANYSMPSSKYVDFTVGASGSQYTAPANGWMIGQGTGSYAQIASVTKPALKMTGTAITNVTAPFAYIPCQKGDVISFLYNTGAKRLRFFYAEGEV